MELPIDEILTELRSILEEFEKEPTFPNFDKVMKETKRIDNTCEDFLFNALDNQPLHDTH